MEKHIKIIVLDAMGVIYSVGDDVKGLLFPFIVEKEGCRDILKVEEYYRSASLGKISALDFWHAVDVPAGFEDEYLQRHRLNDKLFDFLKQMKRRGYDLWCLSNDVSEWSKKLRSKFGLDKYFSGFVISGDVGLRKPDPAIFQLLEKRLKTVPDHVLFVDDNPKNLDSAAMLGFHTILFKPVSQHQSNANHRIACDFDELKSFLQ